MALKVQPTQARKKFDPMPEGLQQARVVQLIDLGTRQRTDQNGAPRVFPSGDPMMVNEVMITFEFPESTVEIEGEARPRWVSKKYALSSNDRSNMYKLSKAALGKFEPDLTKLLGRQITANLGITKGGNNSILDTLPPMGECGEVQNDYVVFDLSSPDVEVFNKFPEWIKEEIRSSVDCPDSLKTTTDENEESPFE